MPCLFSVYQGYRGKYLFRFLAKATSVSTWYQCTTAYLALSMFCLYLNFLLDDILTKKERFFSCFPFFSSSVSSVIESARAMSSKRGDDVHFIIVSRLRPSTYVKLVSKINPILTHRRAVKRTLRSWWWWRSSAYFYCLSGYDCGGDSAGNPIRS